MKQLLKWYKTINEPIIQKSVFADFLFFIPRVICGYLLATMFGASKFGMPWSPVDNNLGLFEVSYWFPADVASFGGLFEMFPVFFALMGAFAEAVGGILLLIGFKTRVAAFLIICTMLTAIFFQKWSQGVWSMLPAMGFLWVALYNLVLGSGRFGLDYFITKRIK